MCIAVLAIAGAISAFALAKKAQFANGLNLEFRTASPPSGGLEKLQELADLKWKLDAETPQDLKKLGESTRALLDQLQAISNKSMQRLSGLKVFRFMDVSILSRERPASLQVFVKQGVVNPAADQWVRITSVQIAHTPHWTAAGLILLLLCGGLFLLLRRRRCAGHCSVCGYDLRGSGGARCSECGALQPATPSGLEHVAP